MNGGNKTDTLLFEQPNAALHLCSHESPLVCSCWLHNLFFVYTAQNTKTNQHKKLHNKDIKYENSIADQVSTKNPKCDTVAKQLKFANTNALTIAQHINAKNELKKGSVEKMNSETQ